MPNHFILIFFFYERCELLLLPQGWFAWTGAAWNLWVMMTFLLFYCSSSSSSGRARATIAVIICWNTCGKHNKLIRLMNTSIASLPSLNVGFTSLLGHKRLPNQHWKEREGKPRKCFNNYDRDRGVHAHSCIMGNQGKMTGNLKICTGIQSQLILPKFIHLPRSPWKE